MQKTHSAPVVRTEGQEAAAFYTSIFRNSRIVP
jgi:predicted 3-demethylubiquinone-9 3-methyltransferase (glyoxalase superfamily)